MPARYQCDLRCQKAKEEDATKKLNVTVRVLSSYRSRGFSLPGVSRVLSCDGHRLLNDASHSSFESCCPAAPRPYIP